VAQVSVTDETLRLLEFASKISGQSTSEVLERVVREWAEGSPTEAGVERETIPVHADYMGKHASGTYEPASNALTIVEGPGSGKRYPSPSAAAAAVTVSANPTRRHHNTNGRNFWIATAERIPLGALMDRRSRR
jgi:hypothetical protein